VTVAACRGVVSLSGLTSMTAVTARTDTSDRTTMIGPVAPAGLWLMASRMGPLTGPPQGRVCTASAGVQRAAGAGLGVTWTARLPALTNRNTLVASVQMAKNRNAGTMVA
jgi:hypothetical protein